MSVSAELRTLLHKLVDHLPHASEAGRDALHQEVNDLPADLEPGTDVDPDEKGPGE